MSTRVGQEIGGKYRLVRLLGEGGMGAVYEAQHMLIGRPFALKFVHPSIATSSDVLARFRREAQAAGSLVNEHIAAVTDFGFAEDGAPYLVMEFLVGEDLSRILQREGPLPVPRLADVVIQACRGLEAAHGAGIVHRDLKPENLFVVRRSDGTDLVKILDFGIAKLRHAEEDGTATRTGTTMGTPFYMPPEQARGEKTVDERADVYALGVILYEGLTGTKPHPGDSYNAILYHILSKPPLPLASLRADLPAELCAIVHRALSFDAADRHAGVTALVAALAPFAGRLPSPSGSRAPLSVPASGTADTLETPPSLVRTPSPPEQTLPEIANTGASPTFTLPLERGSLAVRIALVAAVALAGGGAMLLSSRGETPVAPATSAALSLAVPEASVVHPPRSAAPEASVGAAASASSAAQPSASREAHALARAVIAPAARAAGAVPAPAATPTAQRPAVAAFDAPSPATSATKPGRRPLSFDKSNPYGP